MATILEDFEDTTLNLAITGTWARASDYAASGTWSLKSALIGNSGATEAVVVVPANAESVSFSYRVSSEAGFDQFHVVIDGVEVLTDSGEIDWTPVTFDVLGKSTVTFSYTKDESFLEGEDAAWVDQIGFTTLGDLKDATDSGTLAETASIAQAPEVAKASADSGGLVETRWASQPEGGTIPPSIRTTSTTASGNATYSVSAPAGVALNDVLIAIQAADRGSTAAMTTPTGGTAWQLLDALDGIGENDIIQAIRVWWKRAGSSEPGLYTFAQTGGSDGVCLIVAVKDASQSAVPKIARSTDGTGLNITTPGITPMSDGDVELRLVAVYSLGTAMTVAAPDELTALAHIQSRIYTVLAAAARTLQFDAPTGPADFVASVNEVEWRAGYTLAIAPAVTGPPQAPKAAADAASVVESSTTTVVPDGQRVAANDAGTLTETAAAMSDVAASDMAVLIEAPALDVGPGGADQATLAEASMLELRWIGADQAHLTDRAQVNVQATSVDAGALAELVDVAKSIGPVSSDSGTLAEATAVVAQAAAADIGALNEAASAVVAKEASDSGQFVESVASTGLDVADAAAFVEHAAVHAVIAGFDGASLADSASFEAPKYAADAAVLAEQAEVGEIRAIGGAGLVRRGWSAHSPRRRWAVGRPRRAWRANSPHT
ncbi:hypothetical protein [Nonomuraea diastatica]|uniref:Uncharacterized protein n=1 Tax=Nonomuraea diastatica TaxID=1848329 RepID=A0A4V2YCK4_9ACTN|nr:hypothetical protein [Nonomuraea diastatica]TDD11856.1 hypothetical protein E1294_44410 [Nonomuraea diastatica]